MDFIVIVNLCSFMLERHSHNQTHTHNERRLCPGIINLSLDLRWLYLSARLIHHSFYVFRCEHTHTREHRIVWMRHSERWTHGIHGAFVNALFRIAEIAVLMCVVHIQMADEHALYGFAAFTVFQSYARIISFGCHAVPETLHADWSPVVADTQRFACNSTSSVWVCCVVGVIPTLFNAIRCDSTRVVVCVHLKLVWNSTKTEMKYVCEFDE